MAGVRSCDRSDRDAEVRKARIERREGATSGTVLSFSAEIKMWPEETGKNCEVAMCDVTMRGMMKTGLRRRRMRSRRSVGRLSANERYCAVFFC